MLDMPCAACTRPLGDHTLRQYHACDPALDLPFEVTPDRAADSLRAQLGFDEGTIVADHCIAKAATLDLGGIRTPVVIHEFAVGRPMFAPTPVVTVAFLGAPGGGMAKYGRLIDTASRAAVSAAGGR